MCTSTGGSVDWSEPTTVRWVTFQDELDAINLMNMKQSPSCEMSVLPCRATLSTTVSPILKSHRGAHLQHNYTDTQHIVPFLRRDIATALRCDTMRAFGIVYVRINH